jgi:hypothetical protein
VTGGGQPGRRRGVDDLGGPGDEGPLRLEAQQAGRLVEADPANLIELMVVALQVATDRFHQEVVDSLVDPRAALDEPVFDRVEDIRDPDLEPGLLADLANGGLLARLTRIGRALRQGPGVDIAVAAAGTDDK